MDCCSDEVDSTGYRDLKGRSSGSAAADGQTGGREDGASIEIAKRRRGRPPGSKNKPKPHRAAIAAASGVPTLTPSSFPSSSGGMQAHILEIPGGRDVAAALSAFSRRRGLGVYVLGGRGTVADVTLRQPPHPSSSSSSTVTLRGRFDVLSVSAIFLPPTLSAAVAVGGVNELKVCVSGQQGCVLGGTVMGPLVTAGTLVVMVAAFTEPTFHRLPEEEKEGGADGGTTAEAEPRRDEDDKEENVEVGGGHAMEHQYEHGNYFDRNHTNGGAPGGLYIYGGAHFYSDMLWQMSPPH